MTNQNTAKTAQKQPGLVPKLRFPEFKDAGEWEVLELNNVADFISEKVPLKSIPLIDYVSTENILSDYEGIEIASKLPATGSVTQYAKNDILISNIRPYLKKVWFANKAGGSSNDVIVVRAKEIILASYLSFILKNDAFIDYVMQGAKGVKMPRGDIELIKKYNIVYPKQQEQQKIADCLASLDELISGHGQKLEALKTHKKGLMQNLFPAQGQTTPQYRFPEFKNAGEWKIGDFNDAVTIIDGDRGVNYPKAEEFSNNGFCVFLNAKNVTKNGFAFDEVQFISQNKDTALRKGKLKRSDVILTTRGSIGHFAIFSEDISYNHMRINSGMVILRPDSNLVSSNYLYSFCKSEIMSSTIENVSFGNAQQQLTVASIKKLPLCYPTSEEQQKIADCLSSLDDLITAQTQKIDALKQHKKGLMQQLFPIGDKK